MQDFNMPGRRALCGGFWAVTLLCAAANATTHYVSIESTNPVAPYTTWDKAATNIQAAIDVAVTGDEVVVTNGLYALTSPVMVTGSVTLRSVNGPQTTVLDGAGQTSCVDIKHANALVDGFTIQHGWSTNYHGAGVNIQAGQLVHSIIRSNSGYTVGGVYCDNGSIRGCLVTGNTGYRIGGVAVIHGQIENCTIAGNTASTRVGGVELVVDAIVRNCVVSRNSSPEADDWLTFFAAVPPNIVGHSCLWPAPATAYLVEEGNVTIDPEFVDPEHGDYRLLPGSPCLDTGRSASWMTGAVDLDGNPRLVNGMPDMGAYEHVPGALMCNVRTDIRNGFAPLSVTLNALVDGTNTVDLFYAWDIGADGSVEAAGSGVDAILVTLTNAGAYDVQLTISNALGETAVVRKEGLVMVGWPNLYVATNGLAAPPYTNPASAATSIQTAIDVAVNGSTVWLGDGTYTLPTPVRIKKGIHVRGASGDSSAVILDGAGTNRCFYLSHTNAILESLTAANGWAFEAAGGVVDRGGLLRNCIVRDNVAAYRYGGLLVRGTSSATNCTIRNNHGATSAGGVMVEYGLMANCTIESNTVDDGWMDNGAAAALDGIIPFADPLSDAYKDGCGNYKDGTRISQNLGQLSRDIYIGARIPNLTAWLKNPRLYGLGSQTVPNRIFEQYLLRLDAVDRGRWLSQNVWRWNGIGERLAAYAQSWNTGLTPGARLAVLGLFSGTDASYRAQGMTVSDAISVWSSWGGVQ